MKQEIGHDEITPKKGAAHFWTAHCTI